MTFFLFHNTDAIKGDRAKAGAEVRPVNIAEESSYSGSMFGDSSSGGMAHDGLPAVSESSPRGLVEFIVRILIGVASQAIADVNGR